MNAELSFEEWQTIRTIVDYDDLIRGKERNERDKI